MKVCVLNVKCWPLKWKCGTFSLTAKHFVFFWMLQGYLAISFEPQTFILLWKSDKTDSSDNHCIRGGSCHGRVHKARNNPGSSRRNCHTPWSKAHNSGKGDDSLPVCNSLLSCHFQAAYVFIMGLTQQFFTSSFYNSNRKLAQHLSQTLCHLSSFHCHFSFLTFKLSLDCY